MRGFHFGPDPHQEARELIPWVVNGRATAAQNSAVLAHLEHCTECRCDFEAQSQLYQVMHEEGPVVFAAENSFQKLLARVDAAPEEPAAQAEPAARAAPVAAPRARSTRTVRYLAAAVIVQAVGLGCGAWLLMDHYRQLDPVYVTRTAGTPDYRHGARARAVFSPAVTVEALQMLLQKSGAHIIDGPTEAGVYTLGFAPDNLASESQLAARVRLLRADPGVIFAEPLSTDAPP
jgi:hypothetical protein